MRNVKYTKSLVEHGKAVNAVLDSVSPETAAFLRENYQLPLYPLGFVQDQAAKLEAFRANTKAEADAEVTRLREALTDILSRFGDAATLDAVDDDAGSGIRFCPMLSDGRTPRIRDVRRWRAALHEPS